MNIFSVLKLNQEVSLSFSHTYKMSTAIFCRWENCINLIFNLKTFKWHHNILLAIHDKYKKWQMAKITKSIIQISKKDKYQSLWRIENLKIKKCRSINLIKLTNSKNDKHLKLPISKMTNRNIENDINVLEFWHFCVS